MVQGGAGPAVLLKAGSPFPLHLEQSRVSRDQRKEYYCWLGSLIEEAEKGAGDGLRGTHSTVSATQIRSRLSTQLKQFPYFQKMEHCWVLAELWVNKLDGWGSPWIFSELLLGNLVSLVRVLLVFTLKKNINIRKISNVMLIWLKFIL